MVLVKLSVTLVPNQNLNQNNAETTFRGRTQDDRAGLWDAGGIKRRNIETHRFGSEGMNGKKG
jgi:hypothetical protein